jgi:hypothetical protein
LDTDSRDNNDELDIQKRVSDRLVDLIDIVFGLVVAINLAMIIGNAAFKTPPTFEQVVSLSSLSILAAYVAIVLSWIGYHQMVERDFYKLDKRWGYFRFAVDIVIVFFYTILIYSINITTMYLACFVIIFFLYYLGGKIRNIEYGEKVSWTGLSLKYLALFFFLFLISESWDLIPLYFPMSSLKFTITNSDAISRILILAVLGFNLTYRYERAMKGFKRKH